MYRTKAKAGNYSANSVFGNRLFLYEVINLATYKLPGYFSAGISPRGSVFIKVPYRRISQFMQTINRQGGKILSVKALTEDIIERYDPGSSLAWWLEISTQQPQATYYFGPFSTAEEAQGSQGGYLEDLEQEGAQDITVQVKWCKPKQLTIF